VIQEALEYLVGLNSVKPANLHEVDGRTYADRSLELIEGPVDKAPQVLKLAGLRAMIDYIMVGRDIADNGELREHVTLYVDSPRVVSLVRSLDLRHGQRHVLAIAQAPEDHASAMLNRYMSHEDFMLLFRANFAKTPEWEELLRVLGTMYEENIATSADDGYSQKVQIKKGAQLAMAPIKPVVQLCPFRTFVEIELPEVPFIPRLREGLQIGLWEVKSAAWELVARERISRWLTQEQEKWAKEFGPIFRGVPVVG
jgi:hypothetical protein